jgi:hypothetical protein
MSTGSQSRADRLRELEQEIERLRACDCAASEDGNPHHQGFCRSLPTAEKRERAKRTAHTIAQLSEHGRDSNALAGELAGVRDELATARAEVEDWRDKWAIVDEDRCEAQDRAERAEARLAKVAALEQRARRELVKRDFKGAAVVLADDIRAALAPSEDGQQ